MTPEIIAPELPLMAGAVALGAVAAISATLVFFPVIDRYVRPRFKLERGAAMLLLLVASLLAGVVGGTFGYFWLSEREADRSKNGHQVQVSRLHP